MGDGDSLDDVEEELLESDVDRGGIVPTTLVRVIVADGMPPEVDRRVGNAVDIVS